MNPNYNTSMLISFISIGILFQRSCSHIQQEKKSDEFLKQSLSLDRKVITIEIGSCGNRMSCGFWRNILDEHT